GAHARPELPARPLEGFGVGEPHRRPGDRCAPRALPAAHAHRSGVMRAHHTPCDGANESLPFAPEMRSALNAAKPPRSRCSLGRPTPAHASERTVRNLAGMFHSVQENVTRCRDLFDATVTGCLLGTNGNKAKAGMASAWAPSSVEKSSAVVGFESLSA